MRKLTATLLIAGLPFLASGCSQAGAPEQSGQAVPAGEPARGRQGYFGSSRADQAVLVTGDRIAAVGPTEAVRKQASPEAEIVDLGACCLAPGLIDSHTHLSLAGDGRSYVEMFGDTDEMMVLTGAMNLQRHLAAGITTIPSTSANR